MSEVEEEVTYPFMLRFKKFTCCVLKDYFIERISAGFRICYRICFWNNGRPKFETRYERYDKRERRWKPTKNQGMKMEQVNILVKILPAVAKDLAHYNKLYESGELEWLTREELKRTSEQ